jgi:hypothetical protein
MATIKSRSITSRESLIFLREKLKDLQYLGIKWENHKKTSRTKDTYQLTIDRISDAAIGLLIESEYVKDVYYNPSMAPQGAGYGIDLRYRLYVCYEKIPIKGMKVK